MTRPPVDPPSPEVLRHVKRWTLFSLAEGDAITDGDPAEGSSTRRVLGGRFEVGELIGSGATSCVYECRDLVLGSMAAIKVLKVDGEEQRRRFIAEARLLANLRHPHVVQVLAVGETDRKAPFMVLELLAGQNLDQRLVADGPLPWRESVEFASQVAGALAALNAVGVIHRDVKPSNMVQVRSAAGRPLIKLIDLGIAKVEDWERVQTGGFQPVPRHQTDVGKVVGTHGFYPPEAGLVAPNPMFDIFGLGATIYLLCTGELPDLANYRPMGEIRPGAGFPPELEALVAAAVAVLPEDRLATAVDFQRRLDEIRAAHVEESSPFLFEDCYELLELLGSGAKGDVYRAYHRDAAVYVALKILSEKSCNDPEERIRFAREARVLSAVRHPALPELVECRTSTRRKRPYIAMTLKQGKPARDVYYGGGSLKPADVLAVGRLLAGALAAMHAKGIVYRDIHGGNVLIDVGRETTAALVDCGMVELEDKFYAIVEQRYPTKPEDRAKLVGGGLLREFAAPETLAGHGWTAKSDVYSLGLLLYLLLTGKRPQRNGVISPLAFVPACPRMLASAVLAALAEDPGERVDVPRLLAMFEMAADELVEAEMPDDVREAESLPAPTHEAAAAMQPAPSTPPPASTPVVEVISATNTAEPARGTAPRTRPRPRGWARGGMAAMIGVIALGLVVRSPRTLDAVQLETDAVGLAGPSSSPPAVAAPEPVVVAPTTPAATTPTSVAPAALPPMRVALDGAAAGMRRCAEQAGGLVFVEFTIEAERSEFASVVAGNNAPEAINRCVNEAARRVRFQPTASQVFTEEYSP
jgi:serine/threonine protein kinase